jgi:hypothetical protein
MSVELFGPKLAPYATLACVVSFLMTGARSVYPSQIVSMDKSPGLRSQVGKEMENVSTELMPESRRQIARIRRIARKIPFVSEVEVDMFFRKTIKKRRKKKGGKDKPDGNGEAGKS